MGQAVRLATCFVVMTDNLQADLVEVGADLYARLDQGYGNLPGTC